MYTKDEGHLRAWASFLPAIALRQLSELAPQDGDGEAAASTQLEGLTGFGTTFDAAALFADASGFTQLTEKLSTLPDGAERMCDAMNRFLTRIIECVHKWGGDGEQAWPSCSHPRKLARALPHAPTQASCTP